MHFVVHLQFKRHSSVCSLYYALRIYNVSDLNFYNVYCMVKMCIKLYLFSNRMLCTEITQQIMEQFKKILRHIEFSVQQGNV